MGATTPTVKMNQSSSRMSSFPTPSIGLVKPRYVKVLEFLKTDFGHPCSQNTRIFELSCCVNACNVASEANKTRQKLIWNDIRFFVEQTWDDNKSSRPLLAKGWMLSMQSKNVSATSQMTAGASLDGHGSGHLKSVPGASQAPCRTVWDTHPSVSKLLLIATNRPRWICKRCLFDF